MQLDQDDRGFSFSKEGPLDMRMNQDEAVSAKDVVNTYSEKELGWIFREYGEERNWRRAARAIVEARKKKPIATTRELSEIILSSVYKKRKTLHPATLVFQALRIFVNSELESIREGVTKAIKMLSSGGVVGALAFHRLEDRIVKSLFKEASTPLKKIKGEGEEVFKPLLQLLTKSPLIPSKEERGKNPRARSAKLRFAQRL